MKKFELNFSFKGKRQYIQGPDIFNECANILKSQFRGALQDVEFVIHRMTDRDLVLVLHEEMSGAEPDALPMAQFSFHVAGQKWSCDLLELNGKPAARNEYDESLVVNLCDIDVSGRQIVLSRGAAPFSAMETLVSMNKAMHQLVFPEIEGSWVFCRWSSPVWPLAQGLHGVCIQLIQALGTRLTRSQVSLNGQVLGHIYFSARPNK